MSGRSDPAAVRWGGRQDEPARGPSAEGGPGGAGAGRGAPGVRGVPGSGDARRTEPPSDAGQKDAPDEEVPTREPATDGATEDDGEGADASGESEEKKENGDVTPGTILTDIVALTAERDDYLQSLQRLKADFDNYRKRVQRLQEEQAARAAADLVSKLLPVLDNLDLAWAHLGQELPATEEARALGQARAQLLDVLSKEGLERVDADGVPFDPMVHDAVARTAAEPRPADGPPGAPENAESNEGGTVAGEPACSSGASAARNGVASQGVSVDEVMRAGYRWRGKVLRPAMVRVRG